MKGLSQLGCLTAMSLLLAGCSGGVIETSCEPEGSIVPICGAQMPEDIVVLPDDAGLLVSESGDMGHLTGAISWIQPNQGAQFVRLADSVDTGREHDGANWGASECRAPDQLSPHGIHLSGRGEKLQLLVVNHSSGEHVLFYEVVVSPNRLQPPSLIWRGCVEFPPEAVLNDVAALPGGGFAVTHMYGRENESLALVRSFLGLNKGHVWLWRPERGITVIPNSTARMPNGIEVDPSGKSIWVNNYIDGEIVEYEPDSGEMLSRIDVPNIDNSAWLEDGRLLVASHRAPVAMSACFGLTEGSCGHGFDLVAVDTGTGNTLVVFSHEGGGPFGPATVAVPYKGKLYAGSFSGDRIAALALD